MLPLLVRPGVVVPPEAMAMSAVRGSGPGGQNVNKDASKVELRVDLAQIAGLDARSAARLHVLAKGRLDAEGRLLMTSQRTRDQHKNLEDARDKVKELVLRALVAPKARRDTKPTRGSVERRITEKKHRGTKKATRRRVDD